VYSDELTSGAKMISISGTKPIRVGSGKSAKHLRGRLVVVADGDALQVVNHVDVEEYLYGVVTKESVASWPVEALRAQAIASRTFALYQAAHRINSQFDVSDDDWSQVYGGVEGESRAAHQAVDDTRGTVLVHEGRPILAMFTSNTGWHTSASKYIYDRPLPYLEALVDPYSPNEPMGHWTRRHSVSEVSKTLATTLGRSLGRVSEIRPAETQPCGRVTQIVIVSDTGSHKMKTRPTVGRALHLPEILMAISREGDEFVFRGGGFGHGLGMSQWGAKAMAEKGFDVAAILTFYYQGAELTRLAH
jgi:stage II sporulation protein D